MKKWKKWIMTALIGTSLCTLPVGMACAASAMQTLLYGAAAAALIKKQLTMMDADQQPQMLAQTQAKTGVVQDFAYQDRVSNIADRLVRTGMIKRTYDVYVNPNKDLNAFETVGGIISVNQGMMDVLSDDELAFTLCHEMQHGEKHHVINGVMKSIGVSVAVDLAFGGHAEFLDVLLGGIVANYIDNELVTMNQEKEADAYGFEVMKNSGYNVGAAPASMQLVYEKYGDLYREGFGRVLAPNNHPQMTSRIQKLGRRVTRWSGNRVQVGGDQVFVNALPVVRPAATADYSSRRRAFLIAGNLARVTHNVYGEAPNDKKVLTERVINVKDPVKKDALDRVAEKDKKNKKDLNLAGNDWQILQNGSEIAVNGQRIMTCTAGDDGSAITKNLEAAFAAKPAKLSDSQIKKLDQEWKSKYGYKDPKKQKQKTGTPADEDR